MDFTRLIIYAFVFLLGQWVLRYYLRNRGKSIEENILRYVGYPFIGVGIGAILPRIYQAMNYDAWFQMDITARAILIYLPAVFLGLLGFFIAYKTRNKADR